MRNKVLSEKACPFLILMGTIQFPLRKTTYTVAKSTEGVYFLMSSLGLSTVNIFNSCLSHG